VDTDVIAAMLDVEDLSHKPRLADSRCWIHRRL
jgi:hypothetical protein